MAALFIQLVFLSQAAGATYDSRCMDLVTRAPQQNEAFQMVRSEWEQPIREVWSIRRKLTDVDFEALMDLTHGLDITVIFGNGVRIPDVLKNHSITVFQNLIRLHQIAEVEYSPESNKQMSRILVAACRLLRKSDCVIYEHFGGFQLDNKPRPFSPAQEQALKWATIHIAPVQEIARAYGVNPATFHFLKRHYDRIVDQKQLLSLYILMSTFGEKDGSLLHVGLAQEFIETAFDRLCFYLSHQQNPSH